MGFRISFAHNIFTSRKSHKKIKSLKKELWCKYQWKAELEEIIKYSDLQVKQTELIKQIQPADIKHFFHHCVQEHDRVCVFLSGQNNVCWSGWVLEQPVAFAQCTSWQWTNGSSRNISAWFYGLRSTIFDSGSTT